MTVPVLGYYLVYVIVCWYVFITQQIFEQQISFMQSLSYGVAGKAVRSINCHE